MQFIVQPVAGFVILSCYVIQAILLMPAIAYLNFTRKLESVKVDFNERYPNVWAFWSGAVGLLFAVFQNGIMPSFIGIACIVLFLIPNHFISEELYKLYKKMLNAKKNKDKEEVVNSQNADL